MVFLVKFYIFTRMHLDMNNTFHKDFYPFQTILTFISVANVYITKYPTSRRALQTDLGLSLNSHEHMTSPSFFDDGTRNDPIFIFFVTTNLSSGSRRRSKAPRPPPKSKDRDSPTTFRLQGSHEFYSAPVIRSIRPPCCFGITGISVDGSEQNRVGVTVWAMSAPRASTPTYTSLNGRIVKGILRRRVASSTQTSQIRDWADY